MANPSLPTNTNENEEDSINLNDSNSSKEGESVKVKPSHQDIVNACEIITRSMQMTANVPENMFKNLYQTEQFLLKN
jgi:hypothetical protein